MNHSLKQAAIFFIGVDGGATKTCIRLEDETGTCLGTEMGGPSNIRLSVVASWDAILATLKRLLDRLSLSPAAHFHVGMGLAGLEIREAYQAFMAYPHFFKTLTVVSDAHAACMGAHQGKEGAVIIAGTGTVGCQWQAGHLTQVGGGGFPHDDEGSGAWLGLEAVRVTLKYFDGRLPCSELARVVSAQFSDEVQQLLAFADAANATGFASLAPLVITAAEKGDPAAKQLLQEAGVALDHIHTALLAAQKPHTAPLPCTLLGGISPFLKPFLSPTLLNRLRPGMASPDAGAILIVRQLLAKEAIPCRN